MRHEPSAQLLNEIITFTVEIKINGSMIAHIYGRNIAPVPGGKTRYEYYQVENRKVKNGCVVHKRELGIVPLINSILSDVEGDV